MGEIRPRTDRERRAYAVGYAMAVNDIAEHGLKFGSIQVKVMVQADPTLLDPSLKRKESQ